MLNHNLIYQKQVWLLQKRYQGGKTEVLGVYWEEKVANQIATENLPGEADCFSLIKQQVTLFGATVDKA